VIVTQILSMGESLTSVDWVRASEKFLA